MSNFSFNYAQYQKSIHKSQSIFVPLLIIGIIILFGVASFLTNYNSNDYYSFYFVEIEQFTSYTKASELAQVIQQQDGAGYVYFDNVYHVIAEYYPNYKDAKTVCENIKNDYKNAKILTITASKFKNSKAFSRSENTTINQTIADLNNANLDLYNLMISLKKDAISQEKASTSLTQTRDEIIATCNNFIATFKTNQQLNKAVFYADEIKNLVKKIDTQKHLDYTIIRQVLTTSYFFSSL